MASNSAKNAAKTQAASGQQALDIQKQMYDQQQQRLSPFVSAGQNAVQSLGQMSGRQVPTFNGSQPGGGWQSPFMAPSGQKPPQGPPQSRADMLGLTSQPMNDMGFGVPQGQPQGGQPMPPQGQQMAQGGQQPPQPGEERMIQGRRAQWDGRGWKAV